MLIITLDAHLKLVIMLLEKHTPDYSITIGGLISPNNVMDITAKAAHLVAD
jgi:hypothetical protein